MDPDLVRQMRRVAAAFGASLVPAIFAVSESASRLGARYTVALAKLGGRRVQIVTMQDGKTRAIVR